MVEKVKYQYLEKCAAYTMERRSTVLVMLHIFRGYRSGILVENGLINILFLPCLRSVTHDKL